MKHDLIIDNTQNKPNITMINNTMISIIIPCFNSSKTISRALISVFCQSYTNYEIIIIDDGSSDILITEDIILSFKNPKICLIKHTNNLNGAAARNTGIKNAKGKYIAFLDADDEWLPEHLKESIIVLQNNKSDLIYSKCLVKTSHYPDLTMPKIGIASDEKIGNYLFINAGFISTPSIIIKTNIAKKILFNSELIRHQDYDFLLRLENADCKISMSDHVGAIVHWENNDLDKKGGTWNYSLNWSLKYKKYLSKRAFSFFILDFVILKLIEKKRRLLALSYFFKYCKIYHLSLRKIYFLISYFFFGRLIYYKIKK